MLHPSWDVKLQCKHKTLKGKSLLPNVGLGQKKTIIKRVDFITLLLMAFSNRMGEV
jgi:hypothetical protein